MSVKQFFLNYLNWSTDTGEPSLHDWLTFPSQHLSTIAHGRVFHDSLETRIQSIRTQLSFYPRDVWLYLIGCCWQRIGQEEHLMGRAGQAGDELGSTLIANRIVRDVMRLIFLLEKQFYPYAKWFGTAVRQWTVHGQHFEPILRRVQLANSWLERQVHLTDAYQQLTALVNKTFSNTSTSLSLRLVTQVSQFHTRPFQVIHGESIANAIFSQIDSNDIRQLPKIGSTDVFIDSSDALSSDLRVRMQTIFQ
jgi:hypothetical protein